MANNCGGDCIVPLKTYKTLIPLKLDYASIIYGVSPSNKTLDSIQNVVLRILLGAFCMSPISSFLTEEKSLHPNLRKMNLTCNYARYLRPLITK